MTQPPTQPPAAQKYVPPVTPQLPRSFWKTTPGLLALAATAVGVVGSAVTVAIGGFGGPSDEDKALEHCQESVIRPQLKSPSTAKFLATSVDHEAGTDLFHVTGQLDAQNGFGAMIRGQYSCNMRYEGGAWTIIGQSVT